MGGEWCWLVIDVDRKSLFCSLGVWWVLVYVDVMVLIGLLCCFYV